MKTRNRFAFLVCGGTFLAGAVACGTATPGGSGGSGEEQGRASLPAAYPNVMGALDMSQVHEAEERAAAARPESPAITRTFLRGHFETRNKEFPVEVEQAMAGVRTDRPVIVWAASEAKMGPRAPVSHGDAVGTPRLAR